MGNMDNPNAPLIPPFTSGELYWMIPVPFCPRPRCTALRRSPAPSCRGKSPTSRPGPSGPPRTSSGEPLGKRIPFFWCSQAKAKGERDVIRFLDDDFFAKKNGIGEFAWE